ncbi:huntingtin isoform X2 [Neocloeon triangulifer]|uniref:huntingtin isoform X2 n=1 Tax=Neocloeon triangulifer TaxID=2078957 RepID=UPI00286F4846|nr:huntingtin isoform X2 [Neocloeon triangulifer]
MASLEKLIKAFESLKPALANSEDTQNRKKEKMQHCVVVAEALCAPGLRNTAEFTKMLSIAFETLLTTAGDEDADVRMAADESLDVITRSLMEGNAGKIQVELHKELKKNGNPKSLRAALWRFGALSHLIRPQKGRVYMQNLVPCLDQIAKRPEELVLETLATAVEQIFSAIGTFAVDAEIKLLLKTFLANLNQTSAVSRRTAANCVLSICLNCKKPPVFLAWSLNSVLSALLPLQDDLETSTIIGALGFFRLMVPHFKGSLSDGSLEHPLVSKDSYIQIYELCLQFVVHPDHNVANAAMECLQQFLRNCPPVVIEMLTDPKGQSKSYISNAENSLKKRSFSQLSVATSYTGEEPSSLMDEPAVHFPASKLHMGTELPKDLDLPLDPTVEPLLSLQGLDVLESPVHIPIRIPRDDSFAEDRSESEAAPSFIESEPTSPKSARPCNVGNFEDPDVVLKHCARLLAHQFLLKGVDGGLWEDSEVRVSVKTLALACLSGVLTIYPEAINLCLDKNDPESQKLSDILLFADHSDPQPQSLASQVAASVICAVFRSNENSFWTSGLKIDQMLDPILKGINSESSVTIHQTLSTLATCISALMGSSESFHAITLLDAVVQHKSNPYWLVRVRLLELVAELKFSVLAYISKSCRLQNIFLDDVVLHLLHDEDSRVRSAACSTLTKIIPNLYMPHDNPLENPLTANARHLSIKILGPSSFMHSSQKDMLPNLGFNLSRVVSTLKNMLLTSRTKHLTFGCCEALAELANNYPPRIHQKAWGCFYLSRKEKKATLKRSASQSEMKPNENCSPATLFLSSTCALLTTSQTTIDLGCQQKLLNFAGSLLEGALECCLSKKDLQNSSSNATSEEEQAKPPWVHFINEAKLASVTDQLWNHTCQLLAMFALTLDDTPTTKNVLPQALNVLQSPIKKKKEQNDKLGAEEKEDKKGQRHFASQFAASQQSMHILDLIKCSHSNYKLTLDLQASEKFLALLNSTLVVMAQILEFTTITELGRVAEELLYYLKCTVSVCPVVTVKAVQKLLRGLFGSNSFAPYEFDVPMYGGGLYEGCFATHYRQVFANVEALRSGASSLEKNTKYIVESLKPINKAIKSKDKVSLAAYIKLFEPMVIKSLEQYTVTSDVELQCAVLSLLSQLVLLRVNYCLLDSDRIFINFVLKQFELIEEGHANKAWLLVPQIFKFLVQLSYEKNHSKAIIGVPEILQLCDGLMASGQPPQTHCIPALVPIVEDVFVSRGGQNLTDSSELETQKEVIVAVLLRLVDYHEVLRLLALILYQSRKDKERSRRWATKILDALLPTLNNYQVRLDSWDALDSLLQLFRSLPKSVANNIDPLLLHLFADPPSEDIFISNQRWLASFSVVLSHLLVASTEEDVLQRIQHLNLDVGKNMADPLNVSLSTDPPDIIFARLLFLTVETVMKRVVHLVTTCSIPMNSTEFIQQQAAHLLFLVIYLLESGAYCKVATSAIHLVQEKQLHLDSINDLFIKSSSFCPTLSIQWSYLLVLLGYGERKFWSKLLGPTSKQQHCCISVETVRRAGLIFFSDLVVRCLQECDTLGEEEHLQWLLRHHLAEVVLLSKEVPVQELIHSVHRDSAASGLLLAACPSVPLTSVATVSRLATGVLEGVHQEQTWPLLTLLVGQLLPSVAPLAVQRQLTTLACRRTEMLMLLSEEEAASKVAQGELDSLIYGLEDRHERLRSLLTKLRAQVFGDSAENSPAVTANGSGEADEKWFISQIKERCKTCDPICCAKLMGQLSMSDAISVMEHADFNLDVLEHCFAIGAKSSEQLTNGGYEASPLLIASQKFLFAQLQLFLQISPDYNEMEKYEAKLTECFGNKKWMSKLVPLAKAVTVYISIRWLREYQKNILVFGLTCLQATSFYCKNSPSNLSDLLEAAAAVLSLNWPNEPSLVPLVCYACSSLYSTTLSLLNVKSLPAPSGIAADCPNAKVQIASLLVLLDSIRQKEPKLPRFLLDPLRTVIRSLAALPPLFVLACTPPEALKMGWSPPQEVQFPTLPVDFLLETDVLEQFIFRLNSLGWSNRQHFEESWMAYLGVLNASLEHDLQPEEATAISQAQCLAVRGITSLILQSLALPEPGRLVCSTYIHIPRGNNEMNASLKSAFNQMDCIISKDVESNLDRFGLKSCYGYGQLSRRYIMETIQRSENPSSLVHEDFVKREQRLKSMGLDIHSCLHFLLEHYTQLADPQSQTQLVLLVDVIRSVLMLSDVFTERSQFEWMLLKFLDISKNHPLEDEIMHELLTLGVCKASIVLELMDPETLEKVKKMLETSLRSGFLPSRLCGLQGLLFLLQSDLSDEFVPMAIEYVQKHMDLASGSNSHSERHLYSLWALIFYLLEAGNASELAPALLQLALALASSGQSNLSMALVKGLERLTIFGTLDVSSKGQITRLALERLRSAHPATSMAGLRLLLACMYTGQQELADSSEDPEILLQALEKTSALFDKVKKGYPQEAKAVCQVLPGVLSAFFPPSEMLTKVIGEFISNHQPHPQLMADVVFQLLADACSRDQLPLLQDWLVLCLSNFTQCSPVGMAVWSLTCIFVGASSNQWLKALFPVIQARIGRCESQDLAIFLVAADDFYKKLPENLKQQFAKAFQASSSSGPFQDVIARLAL